MRNLYILVVFCILLQCPAIAQSYTLINDASALSGVGYHQLTPDSPNTQYGGVYQNTPINLNNSCDYKFCVFLGCNANGGGGICFVLSNNITRIGAIGADLGYKSLADSSLAVEYDTWQNGWDPDEHHMAMETGGSVQHNVSGPVCASTTCTTMKDCA